MSGAAISILRQLVDAAYERGYPPMATDPVEDVARALAEQQCRISDLERDLDLLLKIANVVSKGTFVIARKPSLGEVDGH